MARSTSNAWPNPGHRTFLTAASLASIVLLAGCDSLLTSQLEEVALQERALRVTNTDPSEAEQGATLEVRIFGEGFAEGDAASWDREGVADTLIVVSSVTFVSESELVASIRITSETDLGLYDVAVTRKRKKGLGSEVRAVAPEVFEVIKAESLPAMGFDFASAFSINDAGTIVGAAVSPHVAGLWSSGKSVVFGTRPSVARGINSDGYIVGGRGKPSNCSMYDDCTWTAYVYHPDSGFTDLQLLDTEESAEARAINESGTVVGGAGHALGGWRPVVWQRDADGGYRAAVDLPRPNWHVFGTATAINARGDIVGTIGISSGSAVLWTIRDDGSYENPVLMGGSDVSRANGINADGWIVGATSSGGAALWLPSDYSTPVYLDEAGSGVAASEAHAISEAGHIVGWRELGEVDVFGNAMCCEYWGQGALWQINESGVVIETFDLPATSGHNRSTARSVNRHGLAVGYSWIGGRGFSYREATFWRTDE